MILQEIMKGTVLNSTANLTIDLNSVPKVSATGHLHHQSCSYDEFNVQLNQN